MTLTGGRVELSPAATCGDVTVGGRVDVASGARVDGRAGVVGGRYHEERVRSSGASPPATARSPAPSPRATATATTATTAIHETRRDDRQTAAFAHDAGEA